MPPPKEHQAPPAWTVPAPYGYAKAVTTAGSVGAPLLAGFTVTLMGIVIGYGSDMGAPGLALVVLSAAAVVLIAAVQFSFAARSYAVDPREIAAWYPDYNDDAVRQNLVDDQAYHAKQEQVWGRRFRRAYNFGILLLLAGVAVVLIPPGGDDGNVGRWFAVAIMFSGAVAEIYWIVDGWAGALSKEEWWQERQADR